MRYRTHWQHIEERDIDISLEVQMNNVLYVYIQDRRGYEKGPAWGDVVCLEFYTLPRQHETLGSPSPWPAIAPATTVAAKPLNKASKEAVAEWLIECNSKHSCSPPGRLPPPKRLIRIFAGKDTYAGSLIETDRLVSYQYAALSYCWGGASTLKTVRSSFELLKRGIPRSELPKTINDALEIAKWLQLKYIWIDSLCIIQDTYQDWHEQAAQVAEIYEGAYITIAASGASDCNTGCMRERETSQEIHGVHDCGTLFSVFVRRRLGHRFLFHSDNTGGYPLFSRGWCFQERLLSRRILHFTPTELVFECGQGLRCECSRILQHGYEGRLKREYTEMLQRSFTAQYEDAQPRLFYGQENSSTVFWEKVIMAYNGQKLTYDRDILVALSGIANRLSHIFGHYLAGLWEYRLPTGLLWVSSPGVQCHRPREFTAPSFSWASRIGPITQSNFREQDKRIECRVLRAQCFPKGSDIMGPVASGFIKLAGYIITVSLKGTKFERSISHCLPGKEDETGDFSPDTVEDMKYSNGTTLFCFQVSSWPDVRYMYDCNGVRDPTLDPEPGKATKADRLSEALVLKAVAGRYQTYERVGMASPIKTKWFGGISESEITII
ncbi:MAG: hypothetical protein M1839_002571 [Geoglossum umbratile]|nr:MAG: hypothetical protein M1839_002571 [Geoglossum umbratile]